MATDNILIRSLVAADVPDIRALHSHLLPVIYPPAFFTQLLVLQSRICIIALHRTQPVAFISAALHKPSPAFLVPKALDTSRPRVEILTLGVLPAYQRLGLAQQLIRTVVDRLCGPLNAGVIVHANVATTNATALKFYESIGLHTSSEVIHNLYRTCLYGSRDAYLVSGRLNEL